MKRQGSYDTIDATSGHIVIGLTGGTGSGKSEAAKILKTLGAAVIDADAVSREVVERRDVQAELVGEFGAWVVDEHGRFNRSQVSKKAFSDKIFLERLTKITHKYIIKAIGKLLDDLKARADCKIIVIDAPIPVKHGFLDISDFVWVLDSPREQRRKRIIERDGLGPEDADARLMAQMPDGEYKKLADALIDNSGGLDALEREIGRLYAQVMNG